MRLIYLYFTYDKYNKKVFKDGIELNFDSKLRFKLQGDRLVRVDPICELPEGFFSVLPEYKEKPVVDSVSVIAGGNGAGKTSVVEVLRDIMESTPQLTKFKQFLLLYRKHGEDLCYCKSYNVQVQLPEGVKACEDGFGNDFWSTQWSGDIIYITPHFNHDYMLMLGNSNKFASGLCECADLSPLALMESCVDRTSNPKPKFYREYKSWNHLGAYLAEQKRWLFEFIDAEKQLPVDKRLFRDDKSKPQNGLAEPMFNPHGVTIAIDGVVNRILAVGDVSEGVKKILKKINAPGSSFLVNAFYAYAVLYLGDNPLVPTQRPRIPKAEGDDQSSRQMKKAWVEHWRYRKALLDLCLNVEILDDAKVFDFFAQSKQYDRTQREIDAELCFKQIAKFEHLAVADESVKILNARVGVGGSCRLTLTEHGAADYLKETLKLVDLHFRTKSILDFLSFAPYPRMSAGELSFFTTWGRLYNYYIGAVGSARHDFFIKQEEKFWPAGRDAIVFFDEAETTMHPDWQRRLVQWTIWFFEVFAPWVHPHIIFATHSPMLLSDIPIGNVVRLRRNEQGESEVASDTGVCSFAAHIFDLYKDSFFLEKGTMGAFAADKVNSLLHKLNPSRGEGMSDEEYQRTLMDVRVDDDDLKIAKLIGDPFLSHYVWRRLDELSKTVDEPEDELSLPSDEARG